MSEAQYQIERLFTDGKRPIRVIPFPGDRGIENRVEVGIWVLSDGETREARSAAIKWMTDKSGLNELQLAHDGGWVLEDETKIQILFRALRDPQQPERGFARTPDIIRDALSSDEIAALFTEYNQFLDDRSPLKKIESGEELEKLINSLGKGWVDENSLRSYDTVSLRRIVRSLSVRCSKLTSENSSTSLRLSEPTTASQI